MEISEASISVYYLSKVLALAPFSTKKNSKGVYEIERSKIFTIYSATLIIVMVSATYRGLLFDASSDMPVRMKSATSKVVTALDVSVVVLAAIAGVCCGLFGLKPTQELNARLAKIDNTLHSFANFKRDRLRSLLLIFIPMAAVAALLGMDVWTWVRIANEMELDSHHAVLNVQWYIPFYSLYFILTGLHINFTNTAYGLGRRYQRLNMLLYSSFFNEKTGSPIKLQKITAVKSLSFIPITPITMHSSLTKLNTETLPNESLFKNRNMLIRVLAEIHESLGKCVQLISSSYGIMVLFVLVSCLLHLVATAYFLFVALLSKNNNGYFWLQVLWIIFHSSRLLMVVEPCHLAGSESRRTIQILFEIERRIREPVLSEELKKFQQQLIGFKTEFSASGLCRVNRTILTSFSSAIATYLVILIQFQNTNG